MMRRILFIGVLLSLASAAFASAGGPTFYYKYIVKPSETGAGKVYASNKEVEEENLKLYDSYGTTIYSQSSMANVVTVTVPAYLYAQPNEGYIFSHWARVDGDKETVFSNARYTMDLVTTYNTDRQNPKIMNYIAYFEKAGMVYPVSTNDRLGTVTIDKPNNSTGDVVTMTAIPDLLCGSFKGWRRNNSTALITQNPFTVTVSNATKGMYTAVFEPKGVEDKGVFVRIENKGTKRTLGVCGSSESTFSEKQRYFSNSMMIAKTSESRINSSPAFVLRVKGTPNSTRGLEEVSIESQGINTYEIDHQYFHVENYLDDGYFIYATHKGFTGYLKDNGNAETGESYMEMIGNYHSPGIWNRWNYNQDYVWTFHPLDEEHLDENYFGAEPSQGTLKDGKYYSTMYTAFPYECRDGVKAYTVDKFTEEGLPHLKPVPNGKVPANTAVILECNSTSPASNRLLPLTTDLPAIENNLLKGEIWLDNESDLVSDYRTAFDPSTMRVLSSDKASFVSTNTTDPFLGDEPLTHIVNNTCYLDVSGMDVPEELTFTTQGDSNWLRGDADGNGIVNVVDVMHVVAYILSQDLDVFVFKNADTDENQQINVVDAMWIVDYILRKN